MVWFEIVFCKIETDILEDGHTSGNHFIQNNILKNVGLCTVKWFLGDMWMHTCAGSLLNISAIS